MINELNKEYEKLNSLLKNYALSLDQLDEYQEIKYRIKELRTKIVNQSSC
jgi:hypothetical protein